MAGTASVSLRDRGRVVTTQLAPGVILLAGGSHNGVAVEFKDFVTGHRGAAEQPAPTPWSPKCTSSSPASQSAISSTPTTTSIIWVACVASWRKALPSSPTTAIETSTSESFWRPIADPPARPAVAKAVCTDGSRYAGPADVHRSLQSDGNETSRCLVPQHQTAEARRGPACANPRQSRTERRFPRYTISDGNETIELYHVEGLNQTKGGRFSAGGLTAKTAASPSPRRMARSERSPSLA